jgi:pimeloyl-ACP methyl ester carboxylesterase
MGTAFSEPAVRMHRLQINGLDIRYMRSDGCADKAPLLLLNGIGAAMELSGPLLEALAAERLGTLSLDLPGVGGSAFSPRLRRMRGYADLVRDLLDELKIPQINLMGHSWGGALAQEFARRHGERLRCLVLACTGNGLFMIPGRPRALLSFFDPRLYLGGLLKVPDRQEAENTPSASARIHGRGMALQLAAGAGWTSAPWLRRLSMPTLIVAGERDALVPPINGRWLARTIPDAKLYLVPKGSHFCPMTHAGPVAGAVARFIRAHDV